MFVLVYLHKSIIFIFRPRCVWSPLSRFWSHWEVQLPQTSPLKWVILKRSRWDSSLVWRVRPLVFVFLRQANWLLLSLTFYIDHRLPSNLINYEVDRLQQSAVQHLSILYSLGDAHYCAWWQPSFKRTACSEKVFVTYIWVSGVTNNLQTYKLDNPGCFLVGYLDKMTRDSTSKI